MYSSSSCSFPCPLLLFTSYLYTYIFLHLSPQWLFTYHLQFVCSSMHSTCLPLCLIFTNLLFCTITCRLLSWFFIFSLLVHCLTLSVIYFHLSWSIYTFLLQVMFYVIIFCGISKFQMVSIIVWYDFWAVHNYFLDKILPPK